MLFVKKEMRESWGWKVNSIKKNSSNGGMTIVVVVWIFIMIMGYFSNRHNKKPRRELKILLNKDGTGHNVVLLLNLKQWYETFTLHLGFFIFLMNITLNLYYPLPSLYMNTMYIICIPMIGYCHYEY